MFEEKKITKLPKKEIHTVVSFSNYLLKIIFNKFSIESIQTDPINYEPQIIVKEVTPEFWENWKRYEEKIESLLKMYFALLFKFSSETRSKIIEKPSENNINIDLKPKTNQDLSETLSEDK